MGIPDKEDFLLNVSLYENIVFDVSGLGSIINIVFNDDIIDCHCIKCGKSSTFIPYGNTTNLKYPLSAIELKVKGKLFGHTLRGDEGPDLSKLFEELKEEQYFISQFYKCSRNEEHKMYFSFMIDGNKLLKLGQFPSLADLNQININKYRSLLGKEKYAELSKGIGLISHGIGIGSFIYLRRIFEHLIQEASIKASQSIKQWEDIEFSKKRMDEKIKILSDFLPDFLVENKNIYGILSKGVHELSEDECKEIFPHVQLGIELILDEKIAEEEKMKKIRSAKLSLSKIGEKLSGK